MDQPLHARLNNKDGLDLVLIVSVVVVVVVVVAAAVLPSLLSYSYLLL